MRPEIIFAAMAVLFALLNLILWSYVWRSKAGDPSSGGSGCIEELNEKSSKIEDQLWGVIDRMKELEEGVGAMEKSCRQLDEFSQNMVSFKTNFDKLEKLKGIAEKIDESIAGLSEKIDKIDNR